ncbi:hypothetical protein CHS0354_040220 [Potamilus streckersoni]|uniref:Cordon-bleu ubiquitin-like domain-containing protein n=1 Tax=Potamilus streckersoni TaxID=2493646 RepID=A0AAE0SGA4_9BIVA|nr:hypothetical protein CHS0354_040220 [Potamilus streckersoni]
MLKWTKKRSQTMSGSATSGGGQVTIPPSGVGGKKAMATNGRGHPPLTYNNEPADDENMNEVVEENVDLNVLMPDGRTKQVTVEPNTPMMDLLVNLAASSRLNPTKHTLCVLSPDRKKMVDYKAHQTVGSLTTTENRTVFLQIVPKKTEEEKKKSKSAQPFEMTYRFTINLPHGQKKVVRMSPKTALSEIHQTICQERHFDPACYSFQLPQYPDQPLGLHLTLKDLDLKSNELDFVNQVVDGGKSNQGMPRSSDPHTSYMPDAGEKKSKRSFLSFLGKKDKKFKLSDVAMDINPGAAGGNQPVMRQKGTQQARPKTMIETSSTAQEFIGMDINLKKGNTKMDIVKENVAPLQSAAKAKGKKRPAPPPPEDKKSETVQVEITVESKSPHRDSPGRIEEISETKLSTWANKLHSRNSSDSSGYHELTLSGADSSPDNIKIDGDKFKGSFDSTSIDSGEHLNGDSAIRDMSPPRRRVQNKSPLPVSVSTARKSTESDAQEEAGKKKKRAPLPPGSSSKVLSTSEKSLPTKPKSFDSSIHSSPTSKRTKPSAKKDEEDALNSMEDVTAEFDSIIAEDEGMIMMEDASIRSEDMDTERVRSLRPCSFFAPPPPTEPPPPDSEPVNYNVAISKWDRKDVGVGDDSTSFGPDSVKSSPSSNVLKEEMPDFCEKISKLSSDDDSCEKISKLSSDDDSCEKISKLSSDDDLSNSPKMSRHEQSDKAPDSASETSSVHEDNGSEEIKLLEIEKVEKVENKEYEAQAEQEVSEITYNFMIDTTPLEFQNDEPVDLYEFQGKEDKGVYTLSASNDLGSPRRIPDLETSKEHGSTSITMRKISWSDDGSSTREVEVKEQEYSVPVPKVELKREKEEFIISLEDLNNIDFTGPKKKKAQVPVRKIEEPHEDLATSSKVTCPCDQVDGTISKNTVTPMYPDPDSYENEENHEHNSDADAEDDTVRNRCSELSFTPNSEGEMEHMLEEKSISQIALPAVRRIMDRQSSKDKTSQNPSEPFHEQKLYSSSVKLVMSQSTKEITSEPKIDRSEIQSEPLAEGDGMDTHQLINTQHQLLKQQFEMWQAQLLNNQKLLSSLESDDQSQQLQQLQLQMQIQQNMMLELQENMKALTLQQQALPQTPSPNQSLRNSNLTQLITASSAILNPEPASLAPAIPKDPPAAPIPPPLPFAHAYQKDTQFTKAPDSKDTKPKRPKRYEPELDPREKLMISIRSFPGRNNLKKVPVQKTKWTTSIQ